MALTVKFDCGRARRAGTAASRNVKRSLRGGDGQTAEARARSYPAHMHNHDHDLVARAFAGNADASHPLGPVASGALGLKISEPSRVFAAITSMFTRWPRVRMLCLCAAVTVNADLAAAQSASSVDDELEPRVVAAAGVTTLGLSGFIDKVSSSEDVFPWNATVQFDLTRFLTRRLAARIGMVGSTTADGLDDDERTGAAAPALYATAAALVYLTPSSVISPYLGTEYRARLNERPEKDSGIVLGLAGVQASISSRTSIFAEAGYGLDLTRGSEDELRTRFVTSFGVRVRF